MSNGNGGEKKILVTHVNVRTSIIFLLVKLIVLDLIATLFALFFFSPFLLPISVDIKSQIVSYSVWYFLLLVLAKVTFMLFIVLQWLNEYYEIQPTKIIYRRGIIWRKENIYDLSRSNGSSKIASIGIQQGMLGRIFNYGTLSIYDRGLFKYYHLHYIHNPLRYFEILHSLMPNANVQKEMLREHLRDEEIKPETGKL